MRKDRWIPDNYSIENNIVVSALLVKNNWQLYETDSEKNIFIFKEELKKSFDSTKIILNELIKEITVNKVKLYYFFLKKNFFVGGSFDYKNIFFRKKSDYQAIAISLRETRKLISTYSLNNSIYLEQLSRFIPESLEPFDNDDDKVLGEWITGGVRISIYSRSRLLKLLPNLNEHDIDELISLSGFKEEIRKHKTYKNNFFIPGRKKLSKFFNDNVIDIIVNYEKYKKFGIEFPKGIILYGAPGTGKTYAVQKLVDYLEWPCFFIDSNSVGSPYIHESSRKISDLFDKAINNAPSVLVIDEMEAYLSSRESSDQNYHIEEVAEFLRRIPEASKKKVLIIGITNFIDKIDKAIARKGRFDHKIGLDLPDIDDLKELIDVSLKKVPHDSKLDLTKLYKKLTNKPLSDVDYVLRQSAIYAAKDNKDYIDNACIDKALSEIPEQKSASPKVGFI